MKKIVVLLLVFVFCLCGCAVTGTNEAEPVQITAVVGLSRSIAELWVLAGGTLKGATQDALDLGENIENVGSTTSPSVEAILQLEPDLVLLSADLPSHKSVGQKLQESGVEIRNVDINSFSDYEAEMNYLISLTGKNELLQKNVLDVKNEIQKVLENEKVSGSYLAFRMSSTKNKVLKSDYFACSIFDDLGLSNSANSSNNFDSLDLEAIVAEDPDFIFIVYQGEESEAQKSFQKAFENQPVWKELSAVKNGRAFTLPKEMFQLKPNAQWAQAYQYAYDLIK